MHYSSQINENISLIKNNEIKDILNKLLWKKYIREIRFPLDELFKEK